MTTTWEAHSPVRLVRTFSSKDLAEQYRDEMARLGTTIVIKKARIERRAA